MEAGERRRLRREAAEYYRGQRVPERMEDVLNALFPLPPADLYGELVARVLSLSFKANYFSKFSKAPVICKLVGRKVLDGVGQPTLEVEIYCTVKNYEKRICSTVMATHSQIPENALPETIEADAKERNDSVHTAVQWVNEALNTMLRDLDPTDQCQADKMLGEYFANKIEEKKKIEKEEEEKKKAEEEAAKATHASPSCPSASPPKQKKGGKTGFTSFNFNIFCNIDIGKKVSAEVNPIPPAEPAEPVLRGSLAIGGTSLAIAKAGATISRVPLYLHTALLKHNQPPPLKRISHLGCLTIGYDNLEQLLLQLQTACNNIGLELGIDMYLAINFAAHELMDYGKGKYEILTGTFKTPDEMVAMYVEMIDNFPFIIALIDPLRKEDRDQWSSICCALGSKCYLIAEDAATQISKLTTDQNINIAMCSGVVLKYTNQTKVSDLIELTGVLHGQRRVTILGSPDRESSDESLVDLAVGLGARFLKLGGLSRGERVAKYNRLLAIEEELAANGALRTSFFLTLFSACHEYGHKDWREND
ncbi:Enolase-like protein ENO4 [Lonchura striata]|uniref:phosphopyruvate hydratase n=1 Tax=Lonchura striata TaxID=40157 RepID=A0A218UJA3_9PASE|nr:Enolase-like protein ENO4 [Lonchura striata domestica]